MNIITSNRKRNNALIELDGISKVYGEGQAAVHALQGIDLCIDSGEFVAVMGASGSGKSTCMNILGCLDPPTSGTYRFKGVKVEALSRDQRAILRRHYLGFVFQGFNLLKRTSALENVELPLIYRGIPVARRRAQARQALNDVGLTGWESHTSGELSGGQQQRVAIARAIVTQPKVLLANEPTGNLDVKTGGKVQDLLLALGKAQNTTLIVVTHNKLLADGMSRAINLKEGKICDL